MVNIHISKFDKTASSIKFFGKNIVSYEKQAMCYYRWYESTETGREYMYLNLLSKLKLFMRNFRVWKKYYADCLGSWSNE